MSEYLRQTPLDPTALAAGVTSAAHGAVVSFVGVVRDHHAGRAVVRLEYSAYEPMADAECARILAEAADRWPVTARVEHRIGTLAIGEAAVVVAVAGAHRGEAFDACRWIIEEVKRRVPVWKREEYADGTTAWVDPTAEGGTVPSADGVRRR